MPNAQLAKKPVFWENPLTRELRMGLPEQFPAPYGWEKIVCGTAMQAEWYSNELRKQEKIKHEVKMAERHAIEAPIEAQLRAHTQNLMANARNNVNREFLRRSLELMDKKGKPWEWKRECYLHSEAFEQGK